MMQSPDARAFTARLDALPEVFAYIRATCHAAGLSRAAVLRVELVVEELFTNSIRHGYRQDSDAPVWLRIVTAPGTLCLIYQDAAPAYDPLQHRAEISQPAAVRPVGGLGIQLVRELASDIAYRRSRDRNILTLTFRV